MADIVKKFLDWFDARAINLIRKIALPMARIALFVVFFWFGLLKIFGNSPAETLVAGLLEATMPFIPFSKFIFWFGFYEMLIGISFLIPRLERIAIALLIPHMITTFMPLVLLPEISWFGFLVPTLIGQYIIKNIVIIALAMGIATTLSPFRLSRGGMLD